MSNFRSIVEEWNEAQLRGDPCHNFDDLFAMADEADTLAEQNSRLRTALVDARASFMNLQPDFGQPVAYQMARAMTRITDALSA